MTRLAACLLAVAAGFAALAGPAPAAAQQQLQPLDRIVAVVDEDVILQSELDRALLNVERQYQGRTDQLPPRDILSRQVLERLVLQRLQVARAAQMGINVGDSEVDRAIAGIAEQNRMTMEQLGAQLARDGMSISDLRASVRDEIVSQRLRQTFAQGRVAVSEGEIDASLSSESGTTQYHLAHILVGIPDGATAEQIAAAQKKVQDVKAQLDSRKIDFAAAAVRYSDSPNALEGGDLGWRSLDEVPPSFAQAITAMQPGEVIGTCALLQESPGVYELSKMGVDETFRGMGAGRRLLAAAIEEFHRRGGKELFLESNSRLKTALRMYEQAGFVMQPTVRSGSHYERADVYMVYQPARARAARAGARA